MPQTVLRNTRDRFSPANCSTVRIPIRGRRRVGSFRWRSLRWCFEDSELDDLPDEDLCLYRWRSFSLDRGSSADSGLYSRTTRHSTGASYYWCYFHHYWRRVSLYPLDCHSEPPSGHLKPKCLINSNHAIQQIQLTSDSQVVACSFSFYTPAVPSSSSRSGQHLNSNLSLCNKNLAPHWKII